MQHPLVLAPDDPCLEKVRAMCMTYPEVAEVQSWGRPTFRVAKKIFVVVGSSMDRPHSIVFKPDAEERPAYLQDTRFWAPPYWGPSGWLAIGLDNPDTDWRQIAEFIDTSYRLMALKRHVRVLDARGGLPLA
ncbi:MAG: MmcQ/YjbR family DNA-binding protein [Lacisediminihabitans sp.]